MAQHQRKHYRKRRRVRFTRLYAVLSVLVIAIAVVAGSIVFFRVSDVEVAGISRYTEEEITAASGIREGDNMFLLNKFAIQQKIGAQLVYVDEVHIRRKLPSTIQVDVVECVPAGALEDQTTGEWWLVSTEGKLLEENIDPEGRMQIVGLALAEPKLGEEIQVDENQRIQKQAVEELLSVMRERGLLEQGRKIDLSSGSVLKMWYADRLEVRMKLASDFDYQMRVLDTVMQDYVLVKWDETDTGTLDITMEDGLPHLIRNEE